MSKLHQKGFVTFLFLLCSVGVSSLTTNEGSRRAFLKTAPIAAALVSSSSFTFEREGKSLAGVAFGIQAAAAYERRDVGDESRSAATAAMNEQAYKTNNRLEQSGFKLDTREEEAARLSNAMASFSYDSATSKPKSGYRSNSSPSSKK